MTDFTDLGVAAIRDGVKDGSFSAREVADAKTVETPDKPRFVAGVLGPTSRTCSISPNVNDPGFRNVTFDQLVENYSEATRGLIEGASDMGQREHHGARRRTRELERSGTRSSRPQAKR